MWYTVGNMAKMRRVWTTVNEQTHAELVKLSEDTGMSVAKVGSLAIVVGYKYLAALINPEIALAKVQGLIDESAKSKTPGA